MVYLSTVMMVLTGGKEIVISMTVLLSGKRLLEIWVYLKIYSKTMMESLMISILIDGLDGR
jgi:hypothetical protein